MEYGDIRWLAGILEGEDRMNRKIGRLKKGVNYLRNSRPSRGKSTDTLDHLLRGAGSILGSIANHSPTRPMSPEEAQRHDAEKLKEDWRAVSQDLWKAVEKYEDRLTPGQKDALKSVKKEFFQQKPPNF